MKGFEEYRVKAIRKDPEWVNQYVVYSELKANIVTFLNRRIYFSDLLASGSAITNEDLDNVRIFQQNVQTTYHPPGWKISTNSQSQQLDVGNEEVQQGWYHQFTDDKAKVMSKTLSPDQAMRQLASLDRSEFCYVLDRQVEKAASFYATKLAIFSNKLVCLKQKLCDTGNWRPSNQISSTAIKQNNDNDNILEKQYEQLGDELLELLAFVVINIITLRQILIRYDAYARTIGGVPLTDWYMETRQNKSSGFHNLFQFEALLHVRVIFSLIVNEMQIQYMRNEEEEGAHPSLAYMQEFNSQFDQFKTLLVKTHHSVEMAASGKLAFKDHFISSLRDYFLLGSIQSNLNLEPSFLRLRGQHLKNEMEAVKEWRKTKDLKTEEKPEPTNHLSEMAPENIVSLILNLLACFLYMMNSYIIEPSSAYYANALGQSDALGGILIGAMPMANIGAAVVYSIWTNHSYRQPMFFAGVLIVVGNVLYSTAYNYRSVWMCILGRAITGLGGPRLINRRYVADATPYSLRTAASASFAAATSLGAAFGPAAAILLDFFDTKIEIPFGLGNVYVNGMTGPGYLMALLWIVHLILLALFFNEPNRVGLEELKKREHDKEQERGTIQSCFSEDEPERDLKETESGESMNGRPLSCFKHITVAVRTCMVLIFIKRITLESVMGSTSILTKNRYGWNVKGVGLLQFINGLLVIPMSIAAGWSSQFYEDRYLMLWLLSIATVAMLCLIDFSDLVSTDNDSYNEGSFFSVGQVRYIIANFVAFGSIEACESFVASALSKVVPSALASGTFNSGLLTTLVGTSGRACGDLFITTMGYISLRNLMNLLFVPSFLLMVSMVTLVWRNYEILAV